jgi:D-alanyl-D-alanine dipeptidase
LTGYLVEGDDRVVSRRSGLVAFAVSLAVLAALGGLIWWAQRPTSVERAVWDAAQDGAFPFTDPAAASRYAGTVDCQIYDQAAFEGHDLYICKLGLEGVENGGQYVLAALVDGELHTHDTDPALIPGRVFDPGF